jgi:hypothetical protein
MSDQPTIFDLTRTGTATALSVDLTLASQTLADGTILSGVQRINFQGGEGADTVMGGAFDDILVGNGGADTLNGAGGADLIRGGVGDTLRGGDGDDIVEVTGAVALADGGAGNDLLRVSGAVTFAASSITGFESVELARASSVSFNNLTAGLNISVATAGVATSGVTVTGTKGDDTVVGSSAADFIDGNTGNDILYGGDGNDRITSGPGTDYLYGEGGDDILESKRGTGPDHFDGGAGIDRVSVDLAKSAVALRVDLSNTTTRQFTGDGGSIINVEQISIVGGTGNDIFTGGALADSLSGFNGDDVLRGGGGDDLIDGGVGTDRAVFSGARADYLVTQLASGAIVVTDRRPGAPDGVDTVTTVESFEFSDGVLTATQVLAAPGASLALSANTIAENLASGAVVGTVTASDPGSYTYSLIDSAGGRFALSGANLVTAAGLDFESAGSRQVTVRATSASGVTIDQTFTVNVADQNEAATDLTVANLVSSLAENTATATKIADLAVIDPDLATAFLDNVVTVDDARFEVRDGGLYLKAGQVVDFEAGASIPLVLTVTSAAGTLTKPVTVTVGDVNEAATDLTVSNLVASLAENTATETKIADLAVIDPDLATAFLDNAVTVDDARFEVRDGGLYLKAGQVVNFAGSDGDLGGRDPDQAGDGDVE